MERKERICDVCGKTISTEESGCGAKKEQQWGDLFLEHDCRISTTVSYYQTTDDAEKKRTPSIAELYAENLVSMICKNGDVCSDCRNRLVKAYLVDVETLLSHVKAMGGDAK